LAEDQEPLVGGEGDFVAAVQASAVVDEAVGLAWRSGFGKAQRSCTSAAVRTAATGIAAESTSTWRLTPSTFVVPWKPEGGGHRGRLDAGGVRHGRRGPSSSTRPGADLAADRGQDGGPDSGAVPAQELVVRRRPAHGDVVRLGCLPLAGECRHAQPVRRTCGRGSRYSRHRAAGRGRPPRG